MFFMGMAYLEYKNVYENLQRLAAWRYHILKNLKGFKSIGIPKRGAQLPPRELSVKIAAS